MGYAAPLFDQYTHERPAMKLSHLLGEIQGVVQRAFRDRYWITAEVSNYNRNNSSGHYYFDLVETDQGMQKAFVRANLWAGVAARVLSHFQKVTGGMITNGMELLMQVSVSMHPQYGLSLTIHDINPEYTLGNLERLRQETISRLQSDGIWERNKQHQLPLLLQRIAVISSDTAAGLGDFRQQIAQSVVGRLMQIDLFPSIMQGADTTPSMFQAMAKIHQSTTPYDAIVIIRGGGSKMDLSAFDSYQICRYIALNPLPVITGIGHERDISVADMVAHTALKTPTAVAEFLLRRMEQVVIQLFNAEDRLVNVLTEIIDQQKETIQKLSNRSSLYLTRMEKESLLSIHNYQHRLQQSMNNRLIREGNKLEVQLTQIISVLTLGRTKLKEQSQQVDYVRDRLSRWLSDLPLRLEQKQEQYEKIARLHDPHNIMRRGFVPVVREGEAITNTTQVKEGDQLRILLLDGEIDSNVQTIIRDTL